MPVSPHLKKKHRRISAFAGALCCLAAFAAAPETAFGSQRLRLSLNDNWEFLNGNADGAERTSFDDADWQKISVPHTWNREDAFDDEPGYRRGIGWYRRELVLPQHLSGKRLFLYFEAANHTAEVFLNEQRAGSHYGGYTAFAIDVTDLVRFDRANVIAVRVDNALDNNKPPINGDFTMYGGIYRDVWLISTENIHFSVTDHASSGVRIETPKVNEKLAAVRITGTIENAGAAADIEIKSEIFDSENKSVGSLRTSVSVLSGNTASFEMPLFEINSPRLWSPDDPYLYRVKTSVFKEGKEVDSIVEPLGFRWFRFDPKQGFFLNGKHLKLRGTNRHQDHAGYGNAVPDELQVRDLEIVKNNGFNFLRLAHYPQDPSVLAAADRLGLLLWEEIPVVNQIHVSPAFNENAKVMLREMIRQHRNHPSVILWGYMNEVFWPVPKDDGTVKATVELARELEAICRSEDPSRATVIAFDHGARELYHTSGLGQVTDVIGWNLYHGWYYETFEDLGKFMDDQHQRFPDRPLILSEYGVNGDRRLHSERPKRYDSTITWQQMFHESYLEQLDQRPFIAASAIWNQFDFGSEFRGETIPHINQKGLYTYDRTAKDIVYFYKASLSKEPVLHIALRDQKQTSGNPDRQVKVYTNLDNVELFHNGRSVGKAQAGKDRTATWPVRFSSGENALIAKGVSAGREIVDELKIAFFDYSDISEGIIAVNAGSNAEYINDGEPPWAADREYRTGGWGYIGQGTAAIETRSNVKMTEEDPLFQTILEGLGGYRFDVPAGTYEAELLFAEPEFREKGKRVFDVSINGIDVIANLDLADRAGHLTAYRIKTRVNVESEGLEVSFVPRIGKTLLSGIRVRRIL